MVYCFMCLLQYLSSLNWSTANITRRSITLLKTDIDALKALFNAQEGPTITKVSSDANSAQVTLIVDERLTWFDGHFPDHKVLPGVVQIDWAGKLAKALFVQAGRFHQLTNIKFKSMVMPGTAMQLALHYNAVKQSVTFNFSNQTESFSTGSF